MSYEWLLVKLRFSTFYVQHSQSFVSLKFYIFAYNTFNKKMVNLIIGMIGWPQLILFMLVLPIIIVVIIVSIIIKRNKQNKK